VGLHFYPYIFVAWCLNKHKYFTFIDIIFNGEYRRRSLSQRSEMLAEFLVGKPENHVENLGVDSTKINIRKYCWGGWNGFVWRNVESSR